MRNYLLKTKASSRPKRDIRRLYVRLLLVVCVCGAVFLFREPLRGVGGTIVSPWLFIRHYFNTSTAIVPVYFRERSVLESEIETLSQTLASYHGTRNAYTILEKENSELRALLGVTTTPSILAGVIARPPRTPYDTVIIDKGSRDGILEHAPVYYGSNMALGYIRAVYESYALVTLFSSPHVETTVYVFGPNMFTTAYGEGNGVIRISIPQGVTIKEGDLAILPALDGGVVGMIDTIQSIPSEPEQHAYITLETPLQSLRLVRVSQNAYTPVTFDRARIHTDNARDTLFTFPIPPGGDTAIPASTSSTNTHNSL